MIDTKKIVEEFLNESRKENMDNEAELQLELACFIRQKHPELKVKLEKNMFDKKKMVKKEADIVLEGDGVKSVIELKYPKNGQVPVQMYNFVKDIKFLEQLHELGYRNNIFLAITADKKFWEGKQNVTV